MAVALLLAASFAGYAVSGLLLAFGAGWGMAILGFFAVGFVTVLGLALAMVVRRARSHAPVAFRPTA